MNAATFALLVEDPRRSGRGYVAHCPAHGDERESLSFTDGDCGLVLKCHAGCSVAAIAAGVNLRVADLFNDERPRAGSASRIIATYPYRDEHGELLFEVVRLDPKSFRQRRPDGRGGWTWSVGSVRRVLYRLPELRGQRTAYVVEGEKDADRLAALEIPATTNAGGAGKWRDDYTEQLRAAGVECVVTLPDNDLPGEAHALAVARSCLAGGLAAKIVRLPGLVPKADVSDWLDAGYTREELAELVHAAPTLNAAAVAETTPTAGPAPALVRLADVKAEEVAWLWPGRLARGKLALVVGDPGLGKSFLTLDVAARVSLGSAWPDAGQAPRGDVVLLSAEDGLADTIRPRLDALGADVARVHALRAVRDGDGERHFNLETDLAALEAAIEQTAAVLVVVDPLSAYLGGRDSYKDAEIRGVLGPLAALADRRGVAVVGVMHLTKDQQRRALYRALGSVAFVAAARVVLAVAKDLDDDGRRLLVTVKNNLAPAASTLAFRLDAGRLQWEAGVVEGVDADAVLSAAAAGDERDDRRDADECLRELLAGGEVASREVLRAAEANGIARATLFRAKKRLGVRARHEGRPGERGGAWYWSLPEPPEESHTATSETLRTSSDANERNGADFSEESHDSGPETLRAAGETLRAAGGTLEL